MWGEALPVSGRYPIMPGRGMQCRGGDGVSRSNIGGTAVFRRSMPVSSQRACLHPSEEYACMYYLFLQAWSFPRCWVGAAFIRTTLFLLQEGVMAVYSPAMTFFKRDKKMDNHFESKGGEQNIAQGENPIAKQVNNYGVPPETLISYAEEFGVTKSALASFFRILEQEQVPAWELDSKLREIAMRHKELLERFNTISSDAPEVRNLKAQAKDAIEDGRFAEAEDLLAQARERDRLAVARMKENIAEQQTAVEKRQLSEAESCAEQAQLQEMQYRYAKAAEYWQEAASALPEGHKSEQAFCLGKAGYDFELVAHYADALRCDEQALSVGREIGNRKGECKLLNNITVIYQAQGEHDKAIEYLAQSLRICIEVGDKELYASLLRNMVQFYRTKGEYAKALRCLEVSLLLWQEMGNKEGEGVVLHDIGRIHQDVGDDTAALKYYQKAQNINQVTKDKRLESTCLDNIGQVYHAQENYDAALEYAERGLAIMRQIGDQRGEGVTLNNIGRIYETKADDTTALKYYKKSLSIMEEIGDKGTEAIASMNTGWIYQKQGELTKAESYLSRAVKLAEQLERPDLEDWRETLEAVRTKLREQRN
ncbi:hypothetical protein GMJAKD_10520 [Candidatus Electrothrix aarhusensis]